MTTKLFSIFTLAVSVFAYSPDYFPLQVGNQWIYRVTTGGRLGSSTTLSTVSVTSIGERNGRQFALVEGLLDTPILFNQDDSGTLIGVDSSGVEHVWAMFATPAGGQYPVNIDSCTTSARVTSRDATVKTPAGTYPGALHIEYSGPCADAGRISDDYLPWIGLVRRETTTIAGPVVYELVYSRTGGVTVLSQPEETFSISTNASVVPLAKGASTQMEVRLTLRVTATPVSLTFNSGQRTHFIIRNEAGDAVYDSSIGILFTNVMSTEVVGPGERSWTATIPVGSNGGEALPPGRYTLEGVLTTAPPHRYTATLGFDVTAAPL